MFTRIIRLVVIGWIASMIVGAVAALQAKRRIGPTTDESADEIVASAIFAPIDYHSTATAFRGGTLELWYGGGVIDLRDAMMAPGGATLHVRAIFGGGQILVPASWRVVSNVRGMGGLQDIRGAKGYSEDAPTLTIDGLLIAGGFAVMSELDRGTAQFHDEMMAKRADAEETVEKAIEAATGTDAGKTNGTADPSATHETDRSPRPDRGRVAPASLAPRRKPDATPLDFAATQTAATSVP